MYGGVPVRAVFGRPGQEGDVADVLAGSEFAQAGIDGLPKPAPPWMRIMARAATVSAMFFRARSSAWVLTTEASGRPTYWEVATLTRRLGLRRWGDVQPARWGRPGRE
ncbi:hypothetical protein GCM10010521_17220 [Streptomyces rameus]|uniref:Uncharacterized protein n=1 Tax=Streptomyces rameus TaxID=68261 RepID=A0ABP6MZT2_9ACTN